MVLTENPIVNKRQATSNFPYVKLTDYGLKSHMQKKKRKFFTATPKLVFD